jgi:hypothetical protein
MNWDILDFVVAGVLISSVAVAFWFIARRAQNFGYKMGAAIAVIAAFLLFWINGAVGIIGGEGNVANLMFVAVLAVAGIAGFMGRFGPQAMRKAALLAAGTQALIPIIAIIAGFGTSAPSWPFDILILSSFFTALWLLSALLFHRAIIANNQVTRQS